MDRNHVMWAIVFEYNTPLPDRPRERYLRNIEHIATTQSRVIHLDGISASYDSFADGEYDEELLEERLQPRGPFHGVGEIALYWPQFETITFSGPQLQTVFKVVDAMGGIVMLHPREWDWDSTDPVELEEVVKSYPNITFLFHGHSSYMQHLLLPLMDKYPNVFFTYDVIYMLVNGGLEGAVGPVMPELWPEVPTDEVEQFLANVERVGMDTIVEWAIKDSALWFEKHPDRIFWGTDLFYWAWAEPASDKFADIGRKFISELPEDLQEDYAYGNALRVFGRRLIPNQ